MAKRNIPKGQINKNRVNLGALNKLMKDLSQQYSIRVGIIGEKAAENHKGTDLTNAELGAVHEFGTADGKITARSFLRETLLTPEGKKKLMTRAVEPFLSQNRETNLILADIDKKHGSNLVEKISQKVGEEAFFMVLEKFDTDLTDTGELRDSISYEVKRIK